jgi:hypothetical protein
VCVCVCMCACVRVRTHVFVRVWRGVCHGGPCPRCKERPRPLTLLHGMLHSAQVIIKLATASRTLTHRHTHTRAHTRTHSHTLAHTRARTHTHALTQHAGHHQARCGQRLWARGRRSAHAHVHASNVRAHPPAQAVRCVPRICPEATQKLSRSCPEAAQKMPTLRDGSGLVLGDRLRRDRLRRDRLRRDRLRRDRYLGLGWGRSDQIIPDLCACACRRPAHDCVPQPRRPRERLRHQVQLQVTGVPLHTSMHACDESALPLLKKVSKVVRLPY